jgi:tight adherence protein C
MSLASPLYLIVLGGMLILAGAGLAVRAVRPAPPRLSAVMAQLNAQPARRLSDPTEAPARHPSWLPAAAVAFAERHAGAREEDLAILGRSRAELAVTKLGWAVGGALFPALIGAILTLGGVHLPFVIPVVACVGIGLFCWVNPSRQLAEDADEARVQFRSALAAYLALVGLERKARGSATEALEEASRVSGSRPFRLIHTEVLRAELDNELPWAALKDLGRRIDVEELVNLADIVSVAADGAAVFDTLMAEARSMRNADNVAQLEQAGKANERLVAPNVALFACFGALLVYPAAVRIIGGG